MRTNEERIAALHSRTVQLRQEQENRRFAAYCAAGMAVCASILVCAALLISRASSLSFSDTAAEWMNASIFSDSKSLGYITIAILAFLLGITVTVFCFRLKKWMDRKERKDS